MKLSMSLLAKKLTKYEPEIHIVKDSMSIRGIRFLSDDRYEYGLEYVYVGKATAYFQGRKYQDAMILVCAENQIICHSSDLEMLLNDILAVFDYYAELDEQLVMASARHRPLVEMMDSIAGLIDSPLLVFDMEGLLICGIHQEQLPASIYANICDNRMIGLESLSQVLVDEHGNIWHDITDKPILLHPKGNDTERAVSMYMHQGEDRIGYIMIFPTDTNEERIALQCEQQLSDILSQAKEFTNHTSVYLAAPQILRQFIAGEQPADAAVRRFMREQNMTPFMILLLLQSTGTRNFTIYHMIISELKQMRSGCTLCEYQNMVAILTDPDTQDRILNILKRKKWLTNLAVGVSMPFHRLDELPIAFEQARFAVTISEESGIRLASDYALDYLLRLLRENEMSSHLRHPAIPMLENYDNQNRTDLLLTLETYLRQGCSQGRTAQALHIHLNSLKYRLRRITELTGLDLHDNDEMFYMQLSVRI